MEKTILTFMISLTNPDKSHKHEPMLTVAPNTKGAWAGDDGSRKWTFDIPEQLSFPYS